MPLRTLSTRWRPWRARPARIPTLAAFTVNDATTVCDFAGEYLLGVDCTMTGKSVPAAVEFDGVVIDGGTGSRIEADTDCSTGLLKGAYSLQGDGFITAEGKFLSISEIGSMDINGAGCTANATFRIGEAHYVMNFAVANLGNSLLFSTTGGGITSTVRAARQFAR